MSRRRPAARAGVAALAAVIVLALASCAGQLKPVALPHKSPTRAAAATPTTPTTTATPSQQEQQQKALVIQADVGYTDALTEAEESGNASAARIFLGPYVTADALDQAVAAFTTNWSQGERFTGEAVPHILDVTFPSSTVALVRECDDLSTAHLEDATGKIVPGTQQNFQNVINKLMLVGGCWLLDVEQDVGGGPCGD